MQYLYVNQLRKLCRESLSLEYEDNLLQFYYWLMTDSEDFDRNQFFTLISINLLCIKTLELALNMFVKLASKSPKNLAKLLRQVVIDIEVLIRTLG